MTAGRRETQRAARFKPTHKTPVSGGPQVSYPSCFPWEPRTYQEQVLSTGNSQIPDSKRFAVHRPGQSRPKEVDQMRQDIRGALQARSAQLRITIRENDFQIDAAAEVMAGRDVMVSTATGSGKTMCFQIPVITKQSKIVLVICPLLSLMDDQVHSATRLGIKACAINYSNQIQDPNLISAVSKGNYQLVFISPEFCNPDNPDFQRLCGQTPFAERLIAIAIDEAHLCHTWQSFRPRYGSLHLLRHYFPNVGVMALSATMTSYVRRFIHHSTNMAPATRLIRRPIDRPNIYLAAFPLKHSTRSFKDLHFLLGSDLRHPVEIPQTIVFIDNRQEVCKACSNLWARAPHDWLEKHPFALADVSTALSDSHRTFVMQAFKLGVCRILFATDVAGMGIDFPSVRRVIQWRVGPTLTISALWQRFGRCVRDPTQQGVAIVLYSSSCIIPESGEPLSVLCQPARGEAATPILRMIEDHSTGKPASIVRQHDPLDLEDGQDQSNPSPDELESCQDDTMADLSSAGQDYFLDEEEFDFDLSELDMDGPDSYPDDRILEAELSETDDEPSDDEVSHGEVSDYEDNAHGKARTGRARKRKFRQPASCRGVLWFLNTPQCRREAVLRIFEEPDFQSSKFDIPRPEISDLQPLMPCCDRHTSPDTLEPPLAGLLPTQNHSSQTAVDSDSDDSAWEHDTIEASSDVIPPPVGGIVLNREERKSLCAEIKALRHILWMRKGFAHPYSPYPAYKLLPDKHIEELLRQFRSLQNVDSMCEVLTNAGLAVHPAWQEVGWKIAFWEICA
jgi:superfamily II DNA/RNA helicase